MKRELDIWVLDQAAVRRAPRNGFTDPTGQDSG